MRTEALALLLVGCVSSAATFDDTRALLPTRSTVQAVERRAPAAELSTRARQLLGRPLDAEAAVEIALVNSPALQAELAGLDVALADLISASRPANPEVEVEAMFAREGDEEPELTIELGFVLSDMLYAPLRRRIANEELSAARVDAAGAVLDHAYEVRTAFVRLQAAHMLRRTLEAVVASLRASWELTEALREAGNVPALDVAQQHALYEESRLALAQAELAVALGREELHVLLGLSGEATSWELAGDLPALDELAVDEDTLESRALDRSFEMLAQRHRLEALARRSGLARSMAAIPEVHAALSAERNGEGEWALGPVVGVQLPVFAAGQGMARAAVAKLEIEQHRYAELAVRVRSAARVARHRFVTARERLRFVEATLLPARQAVMAESLLQYNAMTLGVLPLLQAQRDLIGAQRAAVEARRDYWLARLELEQVLAGRLVEGMGAVEVPGVQNADAAGGH
ncbi:MAG: TolC family protein [Sandaracinus sp.]|nr:TolC family protein [Myxococcales bacterium]MCB9632518.1 TolC family protein [Sandaracinus sp.]